MTNTAEPIARQRWSCSTTPAAGQWIDRVYLSSDAELTPDDVLLATASSADQAPLAAGAAYTASAGVRLPIDESPRSPLRSS